MGVLVVQQYMGGGDVNQEITTLSPDEAFAVLGNETRMEILQTLATVENPVSFSELHDHVGVRDSGRFNYHLDQLTDHFVKKTDGGYVLLPAGVRVIEAVLSGALTDEPKLEPTQIDYPCPLCGTAIKVGYRPEYVDLSCPNCHGQYRQSVTSRPIVADADHGWLGGLRLPPAGIQERTANEILSAGVTWTNMEVFGTVNGVCPRCSAPIEASVDVCEDHDTTDGLCEQCKQQYAVTRVARCTNCIYISVGPMGLALKALPELLAFVVDHDLNPITDSPSWDLDFTEEILSLEPFRVKFGFTVDNERIQITVDEELTVLNVSKTKYSEEN